MNLKYRCVLFDLDGTLVDTIEDIAQAMNYALENHGFPPLTAADYRPLVGNGIRRLAYDAMPAGVRNESRAAIISADAARFYAEHPVDRSRPYPGIVELVGELKRLAVKTAVLSNKPDSVTRLVIDRLFTAGMFDEVAGERPGIARKPDPASSWEILSALDRTPRQTILAGDSEVDMETARNIGCLPVGVSWGFRPVERIQNAGAALIVDSPDGILRIVQGKPV